MMRDALELVRAYHVDDRAIVDLVRTYDEVELQQLVAALAALVRMGREVATDMTIERWIDVMLEHVQ